MPDEIGDRLTAHAEPDQDQRPVPARVRVDHGHGLLEAAAQAQLPQRAGALPMAREVEGEGVAAMCGELRQQGHQPLLAAVARAVQDHGSRSRRRTGSAVQPAESFTTDGVREVGDVREVDGVRERDQLTHTVIHSRGAGL